MAIIGKIRDNGWLVLVFVGLALLAFIFTDWSKITGGEEPKFGIGTVYGEKVDIDEFNKAVNIAEENAKRMAIQQNQPPQPVDRAAVWKSYVEKLLLEKEYEALGIIVSESEFDAYLYGTDGFEVLPDLRNNFIDSATKTFNPKLLQARIEEMQNSDNPDIRQGWEDSKEYYTDRRKQEKYFDILGQGMYVTNLEAKNEYHAQKEIKNISYVVKRFREIPDEEIKASDEQLKKYYEEHKGDKKYANRVASREIHFFDIQINPSRDDSTKFTKELNALKAKFATTADDSAFVVKNSEVRFYNSRVLYRKASDPKAQQGFTYPNYMDTVLKTAAVGDIVGPYDDEGSMKIAKLMDVKDKLMTVRHILITADRNNADQVAVAQATTDSLMGLINADNFEEYVTKFSQDPGSNQTGGKYEDFVDGEMVPEFGNFALNEPIGKIGYVQTDFGFHIIEVLDRKPGFVPNLAVIQKTLKPSVTTVDSRDDEAYNLLYEFDDKLSKEEDPYKKVELFDTLVAREGYLSRPINVQDNNPTLYGFTTKYAEDKILELAFSEESKVGDLVGSPISDKGKHVIAIVAAIREKGEPSFEDAKLAMKRDYIQDQKAKRFESKMKGKSLSAIEGGTIQKAEVTLANPQITGAGFEPDVVGAIFSGLRDGEKSLPIRGKTGVFVVKVDKTTKAPATKTYDLEKRQLMAARRGNITGDAKRALTKAADVVDNRRLFNANIRR